jgi:hypothetical protein
VRPKLPLTAILLSTAAACALLFGLLDGAVAGLVSDAELTLISWSGCLAASVTTYTLVWIVITLAVALVSYPILARGDEERARVHLLRIGLALGIFCELYWWTRP